MYLQYFEVQVDWLLLNMSMTTSLVLNLTQTLIFLLYFLIMLTPYNIIISYLICHIVVNTPKIWKKYSQNVCSCWVSQKISGHQINNKSSFAFNLMSMCSQLHWHHESSWKSWLKKQQKPKAAWTKTCEKHLNHSKHICRFCCYMNIRIIASVQM